MEKILYQSGSIKAEGLLLADDKTKKRPAVLFCHAWMGRDAFIEQKLKWAKELGFVGFGLDNYGGGLVVDNAKEASNLMAPLFLNRKELRARLKSAFDLVANMPFVDKERIAVVGFCFGGMCAMELLFSGAPIKGAVSFHGIYGAELGGQKAHLEPLAKGISGKALILHGYDDPMNPPDEVAAFQKRLNDEAINWRLLSFGHTAHAFTNDKANDPKNGLKYNEQAATFGFQITQNFLQEIFA